MIRFVLLDQETTETYPKEQMARERLAVWRDAGIDNARACILDDGDAPDGAPITAEMLEAKRSAWRALYRPDQLDMQIRLYRVEIPDDDPDEIQAFEDQPGMYAIDHEGKQSTRLETISDLDLLDMVAPGEVYEGIDRGTWRFTQAPCPRPVQECKTPLKKKAQLAMVLEADMLDKVRRLAAKIETTAAEVVRCAISRYLIECGADKDGD